MLKRVRVQDNRRYVHDEKFREAKKASSNAYKANNKNIIEEYKLTHGCAKCGYNNCSAALQLHHIDPETKELKVSSLTSANKVKLLAEIDKCLVLCGNCHMEHHYCNGGLSANQVTEAVESAIDTDSARAETAT